MYIISKILQKIFSVNNQYDGAVKYKVICLFGQKFVINITKRKLNKLQNKFYRKEQSLKAKSEIKITFMLSLASMFPARPFLDYLLSLKQSRYKVTILIIPDFRFGIENTHKFQEECYAELTSHYGQGIAIKVPINKEEDSIDVSSFTDILFCALPYDVSHPKYNLENLAKSNILLAMVNYGVYIVPDFSAISFKHPRLGYLRYIFYETQEILNNYKKYSVIRGKNAILSGYGKMDTYQYYKSKPNNLKKTILLAPHHSVIGGYNDILSLSNFEKYADFFLELPKLYPDINWIFRPHPALFPLLQQDTHWGKQKVYIYIEKMKQYKNVTYSTQGDYFKDFCQSDGIIQDCESFLFEYFYTEKPQCYMLKPNINNGQHFGDFGSALLEHCYCVYSQQDIIDFINHVIIDGNDNKRDARIKFAQERIMINYPNVSTFIFNYFENLFRGRNE